MSKEKAAMQMALEWFQWFHKGNTIESPKSSTQVKNALEEAITQPAERQGEAVPACPVCNRAPVFTLDRRTGEWDGYCKHCGVSGSPAATEAEARRLWIAWHHKKSDSAHHPAPAQQPLSEAQIIRWVESDEHNVVTNDWASHIDFVRAIEAAHGIGGEK